MDARAAAVTPARASSGLSTDVAAALKDASLAALVTFGLCIPMIAFRTEQTQGVDLALRQRWGLVALLCVLAFGGRLLVHTLGARRRIAAARPQALATRPEDLSLVQRAGKLGLPLFLGIAVTFPILIYFATGGLGESRYWVDLGILILT
jgi:branched-chain amino acid transport system permease protein